MQFLISLVQRPVLWHVHAHVLVHCACAWTIQFTITIVNAHTRPTLVPAGLPHARERLPVVPFYLNAMNTKSSPTRTTSTAVHLASCAPHTVHVSLRASSPACISVQPLPLRGSKVAWLPLGILLLAHISVRESWANEHLGTRVWSVSARDLNAYRNLY